MRRGETGGGRGQVLEPVVIVNRLTHELLYNWTNGRIWFALLLFWAVFIELRLLSSTNDEFSVVLKDASLRRVASYVRSSFSIGFFSYSQSSPRYLYFELCGDNGDRLMSLLDGIAFAYEANVTAVIPNIPAKEGGDDGWSIDDLIDMNYLIHQMAPNVTIVRQAPVQGQRSGMHANKLDLTAVPPRQRAGLLRETFDVQQVVHLGCPRWTFHWIMSYHSMLRRLMVQSFRPPKQMETVMALSSPIRASSFSCLLEHTEDSWLHFCKTSEQRTDNLRIMSWRECFLSPKRILDYVSRSSLASAGTVYLRGNNESFVAQVRHLGVKTYTSSSLARGASVRVPRDMLDFYVCLSANMSAVNSYSSMGFLLKEARFLQGNAHTEYYNQEATFCPKMLCKEEQRRWQLEAALYSSGDDQRRTWVSELRTNGLTLTGLLRVAKSCRFNFGVGWSCKTTPFTFTCSVDGKVHHPITATLVERPMSGDFEFSWRLPFSRPGRYVAHVWAHSEVATFEMDGSPLAFDVPGMNFFLYGVDANRRSMRSLYLLHDELLQRFGNMSYIYPNAAGLRSPLSRPLEAFQEEQLSARDVLVIGDADAPQDLIGRLQGRGVKVVRWIIEQQMNAVDELHNTGGVLPVCSSHHFMEQYACPPKAWIGRPLSPRAVESSNKGTVCNRGTVCPKRNLILIDHDAREQASTGISIEQLQAALGTVELLSFTDFGLDDLTELYKRARLTLDLFVSGRDPVLFEASLFNVCPLVAFHGSARDSHDFPLPRSLLLDTENITEAAAHINAALSNCTANQLTAVKSEALAMNERFPQQVGRFFSDNVLFYILCRTQEDEDWAVPTILALLLNYPFADIELVVRNEYYFRYDNAVLFEMLGRKSFAKSITVTQRQTATDRNHRLEEDMFLVSRPNAKHLTTWIYQWPPGDIALSSDLVAENVMLYEEAMESTDRMTAIVKRSSDSMQSSRPQFFFQGDLHFDVLALHDAQAAELPVLEELEREKVKEKVLDAREQAELKVKQAAEGKWKGMSQKERERELSETAKPLELSEMTSVSAAELIGYLLLQEPASGTWHSGGPVTAGMCNMLRSLQQHELWRTGAAFLSDEVGSALTQLTDDCREERRRPVKQEAEVQVDEQIDLLQVDKLVEEPVKIDVDEPQRPVIQLVEGKAAAAAEEPREHAALRVRKRKIPQNDDVKRDDSNRGRRVDEQ